MTNEELLVKVKTGLFGSPSGNWRDGMLKVYINEVKEFMLDAGVKQSVLESEKAVGCIMIGVNDLWNYQSGSAKFSQYFKERVVQLASGNGGGSA